MLPSISAFRAVAFTRLATFFCFLARGIFCFVARGDRRIRTFLAFLAALCRWLLGAIAAGVRLLSAFAATVRLARRTYFAAGLALRALRFIAIFRASLLVTFRRDFRRIHRFT